MSDKYMKTLSIFGSHPYHIRDERFSPIQRTTNMTQPVGWDASTGRFYTNPSNIASIDVDGMKIFNTFSDVLADDTLKDDTYIMTFGFYTPGDGGGGTYYLSIVPPPGPTEINDRNFFISNQILKGISSYEFSDENALFRISTTGGTLYPYVLAKPGYRNVKQWGAKGDGIQDDTMYIQAALDYGYRGNSGTVYFPSGVYKITKTLHIGQNTVVYGEGSISGNEGCYGGSEIAFYPSSADYTTAVILCGLENVTISDSAKPMYQCDFGNLHIRDYSGRTDTVGIEARNLQNRATLHHLFIVNFGYCGLLLDEVKYTSKGSNGGNAPAFCAIRDVFIYNNCGTGTYHTIVKGGGAGATIFENVGMDISHENTVVAGMLFIPNTDGSGNLSTVILNGVKIEIGESSPNLINKLHEGIVIDSGYEGVINIIGSTICGWTTINMDKSLFGNSSASACIRLKSTSAKVNIMGTLLGHLANSTVVNGTATALSDGGIRRINFETLGEGTISGGSDNGGSSNATSATKSTSVGTLYASNINPTVGQSVSFEYTSTSTGQLKILLASYSDNTLNNWETIAIESGVQKTSCTYTFNTSGTYRVFPSLDLAEPDYSSDYIEINVTSSSSGSSG